MLVPLSCSQLAMPLGMTLHDLRSKCTLDLDFGLKTASTYDFEWPVSFLLMQRCHIQNTSQIREELRLLQRHKHAYQHEDFFKMFFPSAFLALTWYFRYLSGISCVHPVLPAFIWYFLHSSCTLDIYLVFYM